MANSNQPRNYDAVISGNKPRLVSGAVLGGLPGVKQRLASDDVAARRTALQEALNYGKAGLDLVIQALEDESEQVQRSAYQLLRQRVEPEVRLALQQFNPYRFFECVHTLTGHINGVHSVAFSPDGQILASCGYDGTIKLWHTATGLQLRTLTGHTNQILSVAFSPDGQTIASGSLDGTIKLWQIATGRQLRTLTDHSSVVYRVAFSPNGQTLATGHEETIKLWHTGTGRQLRTLKGNTTCQVFSVAFSPDGRTLASCSIDGSIKLWPTGTGLLQLVMGNKFRTLMGPYLATSVAFSPDGLILASGGCYSIKIWHTGTWRELAALTGHTGLVWSVAFSPDGQTLASGSYDNTIKVWRLGTGQEICTFTGHTSEVHCVAISPDGQTLASGSLDKTIKIWRCD